MRASDKDLPVKAKFSVSLWASYWIIKSFPEWTYEDQTSETNCDYIPFMLATVLMIANWILVFVGEIWSGH